MLLQTVTKKLKEKFDKKPKHSIKNSIRIPNSLREFPCIKLYATFKFYVQKGTVLRRAQKRKYCDELLCKIFLFSLVCTLNANFVLYQHHPLICMNNFMHSTCMHMRSFEILAKFFICLPISMKFPQCR